jgi:glycosyltransferase involved in cell wall biosynthesis
LKRVLHSLNLDVVGGVESIFGEYLKSSQSADLGHDLLILNRRCHPFFKQAVQQRIITCFHAKYVGPFYLPKLLRKRWAAYQASRLRPDVHLIYNTLDNPSAWAVNPYAKTRIYYERGSAWLSPQDHAVITHNIEQTDHFFCNSKAAQRILELRFGVSPERCEVIYNPMRLKYGHMIEKDASKKQRFRIGLAGRLIPVKGMVIALHALAVLLKRNQAFEVVIAGEGPELEKLQEVARDLGLGSAVQFLGVVKNMSAFYSSLDVFVCPSLREPLGNVAIEANGRGCPVICTQVDGLPEAIVPGRTGICLQPTLSQADYFALGVSDASLPEQVYDPVNDRLSAPRAVHPSHLVEAIWELYQSPERHAEMASEAFKLSRERFSMDSYVKNLHALILKAQSSTAQL